MENNGVTELDAGQVSRLRETFKRCSPETIEAILHFRRERDLASGLASMHGIIQRHAKLEKGQSAAALPEATRLREDLGIDSLSLLEIVLSIEEALEFELQTADLSEIRTLGEMRRYVDDYVHERPVAPANSEKYDRDRLWVVLPQPPPFLFLDRAEIQGEEVRAWYQFRKDECFFPDRSHGDPIVPASILYEALGQAGCLWVLEHVPARLKQAVAANQVFIAGFEEACLFRRANPGEEIEISVRLTHLRAAQAVFQGEIRFEGESLATVKGLTIAFGDQNHSGERTAAQSSVVSNPQNGAVVTS